MTSTHRFTTADAPPGLLDRVRRMLDDAFGRRFSDDDWAHAQGGRHVVVVEGDQVLSHAAVVGRRLFVDGRPFEVGFLEAVATAPDRQGVGLGSAVVEEVSAVVRRVFEMGALSTGAHGFYETLGWERWSGPTSVLHDGVAVWSPSDDGGVMVLRHGPSAGIDLAAPIACEPRSGDDW